MTTRSQRKSIAVNAAPPVNKRVENSWILFAKGTLINNSDFNIITLPHPAHGKPAKYCLDNYNKKLYEIVSFSEPYRSWFIGETVKSDSTIQMVTPMNPIFLVLPKLKEQCLKRAVPIEDLLSEKGYEKILSFIDNLDSIADLKGPKEIRAYKYNEDKTLTWLEGRVRKLAKVLREKNIHVTSGAVSATFVTSNINNDSIDEEFYLKYAHGILSEYLQDDLLSLLEKKFDFTPDLIELVGKKRKSEASETNETNKRIKNEFSEIEIKEKLNGISENTSEIKKDKPLTAKEKSRLKAASGTKAISAFFTKKS